MVYGHEIIFTSGGTEASNLAIRGTIGKRVGPQRILTSAIEHPATEAPCRWLEAQGHTVDRMGVDEGGQILLEQAQAYLKLPTALVTVMHALGSVRLSLGHSTQPEDVRQAADALTQAYRRLRK